MKQYSTPLFAFQSRNASINGYMVDTFMSVDVVNGKKANDTLTFSDSSLEQCGIKEIADIEFSLHIFDSEDWLNYTDTDAIQLKTSLADSFIYTFDDSGDVVFANDGIKIVVKGLSEDGWLGPGIVVYIQNESDKQITVQTRDVSVNGFMAQTVFSADVSSGKHCVDTITFLGSDLEDNDISSIENVELSFHIFDSNNWGTAVDTDMITIDF